MKILIVGLGAIGSIYATKLLDSGHDVRVLLDEGRLKRYKANGIFFNSKRYDFEYVLNKDKDFKPELVIIAVKAMSLVEVIKSLKNFLSRGCYVLSLLNGISSERMIKDAYPYVFIPKSYYVGHASMREGNKITYDGVGKVVMEPCEVIENLFENSSIEYEVTADIESSMWQKFIINIGVNQTTAILKKPYSCFKTTYVMEFARGLMQEGVEIAKAKGIQGSEKFIPNTYNFISGMPKTCKTSMMQDVEKGNKTEVDIFAGEIMRLGNKYGISTPLNELAYKIIKDIEKT